MANFSFTQLRTHQVTGTMSDALAAPSGGFDQIAAADGHLQTVLNHMASSLKRLHGGTSAIENASGELKGATSAHPYGIRAKGLELKKFSNGALIGGFGTDASDNLVLSASLATKDIIFSLNSGASDAPVVIATADAGSGSLVLPLSALGTSKGGLQVGDSRSRLFSSPDTSGNAAGANMTLQVSGNLNLSGTQGVSLCASQNGAVELQFEPGSSFTGMYPGQPSTAIRWASGSNGTVIQQLQGLNTLSMVNGAGTERLFIADGTAGVPAASGFSFNGSTNTMKISANGGNHMNLMCGENIILDANGDIELNADGADIDMKDGAVQYLKFTNSSGDAVITNGAADKDIIFKDAGGNTIMTVDGGAESLLMAGAKKIEFGDTGTFIHQSADGVLDLVSDTEIEINATSIDMNGALDVSGNATVGGNLVVVGTIDATAINTTTKTEQILEVVDAKILAASGSNSAAADGGGYLIGGTDTADAIVAMVYDHAGTALEWKAGGTDELVLDFNASLKPGADARLDLGASGAEWKDLYIDGVVYADDIEADKLQIADTNQSHHLEIDWSEDDSADRVLDFKVVGADRTVTLNEGFTIGDGNVGTLTFSGASKTLTVADDCTVNQNLRTTDSPTFVAVTAQVLSASQGIHATAPLDGGQSGAMYINDADNSAYVKLMVPGVLGASYTLTLPADDGTANQKLTTDGSGVLSWVSDTVAATTTRFAHLVSSSVAAGASYSINQAALSTAYPSAPSLVSAGTVLAPSALQVLVNGQMMVSGTAANVSAGTADYLVDRAAAYNHRLKFSFPLAAGDVIIVNSVS